MVSVINAQVKVRTSGGWLDLSSGDEEPVEPEPEEPIPGSPSAPRNLTATAQPAQILLEWDDPLTVGTGSELASHQVEMAESASGPWTIVSTVAAATHQRVIVPLQSGTPFYFRVRTANMALPEAYSLSSTVANATPTTAPVMPLDATWEDAVATGDLTAITIWYARNTGHLSEGFDSGDLWTSGDSADEGIAINEAWCEANEGANVVFDSGRWTITGLVSAYFDVNMSDVTFSHCLADRPFGMDANGFTSDSGGYTGIIIDHCTAKGNFGTGNHNDFGDGIAYYNDADHTADNFIVRYCDISGYRAGNLMFFGTTSEYNWVHELYIFSDSHNTANSVRGENCTIYRNLLTDGTSSAVSFYADSDPYTRFYLTENILTTQGNALQEVNFPMRAPDNWHVLENGYDRQMVGNYFVEGISGDNAYFTRTFDNKLLDGTHLFFDNGETIGTPHVPALLKYRYNELGGGPLASVDTYEYTPTPLSTQLILVGVQNAGHQTVQNPTVTAVGQYATGRTFTKIAETALDPASGDNYAMKLWLYKGVTGATTSFEHINVDPYAGSSTAYFTFWVFEVAGTTGLTLVQYKPHIEHAGFGDTLDDITSGTLDAPATNGRLVMAFGAGTADVDHEWSDVSGWTKIGSQEKNVADGYPSITGATYWRTNFTGSVMTIDDPGVGIGGILLCEFSGA